MQSTEIEPKCNLCIVTFVFPLKRTLDFQPLVLLYFFFPEVKQENFCTCHFVNTLWLLMYGMRELEMKVGIKQFDTQHNNVSFDIPETDWKVNVTNIVYLNNICYYVLNICQVSKLFFLLFSKKKHITWKKMILRILLFGKLSEGWTYNTTAATQCSHSIVLSYVKFYKPLFIHLNNSRTEKCRTTGADKRVHTREQKEAGSPDVRI